MKQEYGNIKVGVEEYFFFDPNEEIATICSFCVRENCPVPDRTIVKNCNSYRHPPQVTDAEGIKEEFRIMARMEIISTHNFAYLANTASV